MSNFKPELKNKYEKGELKIAREYVQKALEINPGNQRIKDFIKEYDTK